MDTPRSLMDNLLTFRSTDARRMWRDLIKLRDHHECIYCGATEDLTIDHIRPKCRGGETTASNCVTACLACNQAKGSLHVNEFLNLNLL